MKKSTNLKLNIEGLEELSAKVEKAVELINEANAILHDVAKQTELEISIKTED